MARGIDGYDIFQDERDREAFLQRLGGKAHQALWGPGGRRGGVGRAVRPGRNCPSRFPVQGLCLRIQVVDAGAGVCFTWR